MKKIDPTNLAENISHPSTKLKFPINKDLLEIYNSSKNGINYDHLIEKHHQNFLILESLIIKQSIQNAKLYKEASEDYKNFFDVEFDRSEFYTVVRLPSDLKEEIRLNGLTFDLYLEILEYFGEDAEGRNHFSMKNGRRNDNQGKMARRWLKNEADFIKQASEHTVYHNLNEAKEHTTLLVYNCGNLLNTAFSAFVLPDKFISDYNSLERYGMCVSFGIYSLYQNYGYLKRRLGVETIEDCSYEFHIKRINSIKLSDEESKELLIDGINNLKNDLNSKQKNWIQKVKNVNNTKTEEEIKQLVISNLKILDENKNYQEIDYSDLIIHYCFLESTAFKFLRDKHF